MSAGSSRIVLLVIRVNPLGARQPVEHPAACREGPIRPEAPHRLVRAKPHKATWSAISWHVEKITRCPLKFDGEASCC